MKIGQNILVFSQEIIFIHIFPHIPLSLLWLILNSSMQQCILVPYYQKYPPLFLFVVVGSSDSNVARTLARDLAVQQELLQLSLAHRAAL